MASSIPASAPADAVLPAPVARPKARRRRPPGLVLLGVGFVAVLLLVAAAAPVLAPQDPIRQSLRGRLAAPTWSGSDGRAHLLGTDHLGRDVLSRVIFGSLVSLVIGFSAVLVGGMLGSAAEQAAPLSRGGTSAGSSMLAHAPTALPHLIHSISLL